MTINNRMIEEPVEMQERQEDIFREAMEKAKKTVSWEKLTTSQKEMLITMYLRGHYETSDRQQE